MHSAMSTRTTWEPIGTIPSAAWQPLEIASSRSIETAEAGAGGSRSASLQAHHKSPAQRILAGFSMASRNTLSAPGQAAQRLAQGKGDAARLPR